YKSYEKIILGSIGRWPHRVRRTARSTPRCGGNGRLYLLPVRYYSGSVGISKPGLQELDDGATAEAPPGSLCNAAIHPDARRGARVHLQRDSASTAG